MIYCEITMLDDFAMYVPFFNAELSHFRPLWEVGSEHPLYALLEREFAPLWKSGEEPARVSGSTATGDPDAG